ncbi:hypothetical protein EJB05_23017 [Eragrostis curvula]|uniref:26S proteasome non-ATPase regulatory subunit 4 homolog n=1 Tax=Eragrostis curvula TaxID=38414 RepID=A0A5J9V5W3_9POAL|nr:hypothetical protein EJB05_23017 [Eragrostis curvula]
MVLEAVMVCLDNSEWTRNGDYPPSRLDAQADVLGYICGTMTQVNRENTVGVIAMAGKGARVLVTPTTDIGRILISIHRLEIGGEANLTASLQIAQLALKHRHNKKQQQRIIVFVGSPVSCEKSALEGIGKKLKKNNVSIAVVDFGESDDVKTEKLEALVATVNSGSNSHIVHVPPGETTLSNAFVSSPILTRDEGENASVAAASEESGFEFGVDPNVDPELALALRISMEEERARKEAAAKKHTEDSSSADSKGQSSFSTSDKAEAKPSPDPTTGKKRKQMTDDVVDLIQHAPGMLMEDGNSEEAHAADAEMIDSAGHDPELALDLQMSVQEGKAGSQSDSSAVFEDQSFSTSVLSSLPGVDPNDASVNDFLALLHSLRESEKKDKKENKPEDCKNQ